MRWAWWTQLLIIITTSPILSSLLAFGAHGFTVTVRLDGSSSRPSSSDPGMDGWIDGTALVRLTGLIAFA